MFDFDNLGADWLADEVEDMDDEIVRVGPVRFNEENRYLPQGVSPRPGFIRYDLFPFLREIIECFDPMSPVREVNLMKGVQTGYTTALESILFYVMLQVKTQPVMFITADKELASGRVENNILPMINESGFKDSIRSADEGNTRKTGKTKDYIQWDGGGFLIYNGALNAAKMRQYSVPFMLKDELDGWKREVGKDGNSDALTDARLSAYWEVRKILRGSTPLTAPSMIGDAYQRGDQRKYHVLCRSCGFPQVLKMEHVNKDTGVRGGFIWETENGRLVIESVRYLCQECGHAHSETDKTALFSEDNGAHWVPTAEPKEPGIRSYHLPAFYSPFRFRPWYKNIADYLESYDPTNKQVVNISKYQEFYNNTLGVPFTAFGGRVRFSAVSAHRRPVYKLGQIPNEYALNYAGSKILFLVCAVDVHKRNLAVAVFGFTVNQRMFLVDYWRFERESDDDDCGDITSPVWLRLRELIEDAVYTADDGSKYRISLTFVDAGYASDTVVSFCSDYVAGVYPILGRERPAKQQVIKEFAEFKTQQGTKGYRILVDHYKDRMAQSLRREWVEDAGEQPIYHFNSPLDTTDKQLKELTVEYLKEETDARGNTRQVWHRPGNAANELWDLCCYSSCGAELIAWNICIQHFELETIDWDNFWEFAKAPENDELFGRVASDN